MILTSIVIQGFKSFADKTTLKFGKGITAVVGPNGSGKSNIADAVRWVLGEQSTKSLRGQSMEDVIFGGTTDRRPHGFCEVTLNIDNSDRSLNFDNDSVSITRRYYRSHESEYQINNVSVRLKDINELFMDTGLGRDGYSMIGQGKIDNIISSKSDERRDIFEEASGISKYRYRKVEAQRKLASAEDNLLRLKDIISELESRVGPLFEQSKKAEKFLELAEEKKQLEIGIWLYTLNNSKDALRSQESKILSAKLQYDEIEKKISEFDAKSENNTAEFSKLTTEIEEKRREISAVNEEILKIEGQISVIKNDIIHNSETVKRLESEKLNLDSTEKNALTEIEEKKNEANEKNAEIDKLNKDLSALETELNELVTDSESISRKIEEQAKAINAISATSSDKRVEMVTADTAIGEIEERFSSIDALLNQNTSEREQLSKDFEETKKFFEKIEDSITSNTNTLKGYELRLNGKIKANDEIKANIEETRLDIEAKKRRIQILEDLENSMEGFSGAVKYILSESKKGTLRGIHGTVSKLITVDEEYSVAIETALGNNIQNIVVDTDSDAKRAINTLKSNNIGRATFMPINSVIAREYKESGFESVLGFVGIANNLIKCDSKYSEIMKYLLGGAVVAEDIDSAIIIAKKWGYRVKVVTLDGQVVNPGGTLTGGARVKQAGILSRSTEIKKYGEQVEKLNSKLEKLNVDFEFSKSELSKVEADIKAVNDELKAANEDKIRTVSELKHLEDLISSIDASIKDLTDEKENGSKKIENLKTVSASAAKIIAELENQKSSIQSQIDSMTGGRNDIFDKRDAISEEITNLKLQIINAQKDQTNLLLLATELQKSLSGRKLRLAEIDSEIAAVSFKTDKFNEDISKLNDEIDNNRFRIEDCNKCIADLLEKRNETEKLGVKYRADEREQILEREKISGELARLSERKEVMEREYDSCIRQLYDEYQLTKSEAEEIAIRIDKPQESKKKLHEIKSSIRSLGSVNVSAIEEFKEVKERYDFMKEQMDDIEKSRSELNKLINQLTTQMQELFTVGFEKINENFQKTFSDLFGGGTARLKLENPDDILESGIDIEANLPGKNVPSLDGLSGGEKALVALSIYFSIMQVNPPPFCFLDEVDTALDDINVDRFADYMGSSKFSTQFICVTHRRGTMEAADMLYGVTMQEKGVTKLLELNVAELEKKLKLEEKGA
ncbi:MAG: chromosome segregation protein SMC [Clostridia bacterium]|nr:chromosome segregation protein SMC [Clostridia bacterium]